VKTWQVQKFLFKASSATAWVVLLALGCAAGIAKAQTLPSDITPAQVVSAGADIVKLVDESRFGELWGSASTATKKVAQQANFNADLSKTRQPLGAVTSRNWVLVARQSLSADKGAIAGEYLNIEYITRFAKGEVKHELVSFRFDEDKVWRFAGYLLR